MLSQQAIDDTASRLFEKLIAKDNKAESGKVPGILLGVTYGGNRTYHQFGKVPLFKNGTVAAQDIVWFIGSNTKVFTATLLGLAGIQSPPLQANCNTAMSTLLPKGTPFHLCNNEAIELWHLATHSAGYPDGPCYQQTFGNYTFPEMECFLENFTPTYGPGTAWNYSDQGFALLGVLLSHAYSYAGIASTTWDSTYMAWPQVIADQLISPLNMPSTQPGYGNLGDRLAMPYLYDSAKSTYTATDPPSFNLQSAALGAGSLSSTLADMLTFLEAQLSPPSGNVGMAISETQLAHGTGLSMGLAWAMGKDFFYKNGIINGYASYMAFNPLWPGVGVVAMANCRSDDDGGTLCNAGRELLALLSRYPAEPPHFPQADPKPKCPKTLCQNL